MDSLAQSKDIAAEWLAKRGCEGWSEVDEVELSQWLDASIGNRIAFLRLQAVWQDANRLKALGAGFKPGDVPTMADFAASPFFKHAVRLEPAAGAVQAGLRRRVRRVVSWSVAAAALLTIGTFLWRYPSGADVYSTPVGGLAAVPLADGSQVTLNTDSEIRVAMTNAERRIELAHGEVYFDVVADAGRPFIVSIGEQRVTVLGTRFSVRRDAAGVRIIVTDGKVVVESLDGGTPVRLAAGSVAHASGTGVTVREQSVPRVEELLSWRSGYLIFHETSLDEAAAEFNRYNARKILIADPTVSRLRISGNFRSTNLDAFVQLLEDGFPVSIVREGEAVRLGALRAR